MNTPRYEVFASNGNGDEKPVAQCAYKQDAIKIANRFLNAEVVRVGNRTERTIYTHANVVKDDKAHLFTKAGLKGQLI